MGLPNFNTQAEGVLPILVMNTICSVVLLKDMVKSILQIVGSYGYLVHFAQEHSFEDWQTVEYPRPARNIRFKSVSKTGYCSNCTVCLCRFKDDEEVSELPCKHYFHKRCLDKWFENQRRTCPLCRSMS